jgi:hypothetical protein
MIAALAVALVLVLAVASGVAAYVANGTDRQNDQLRALCNHTLESRRLADAYTRPGVRLHVVASEPETEAAA